MQEKLKLLYEQKYLDRFYQPRYEPHGSLPFVYLLASKGIKYLSDTLGIAAMCTIVPLTISNAPRLMFPMTWLSMKS